MSPGRSDLPSIDDPDIAARLEALDEAAIDRLPFGVIRLDPLDKVVLYSDVERRQSGYRNRPALGLDFFFEIAPCMNGPEMRGRVEAARVGGLVDIEIGWIGDFSDCDRAITMRIVSASDTGLWLLMMRDGMDGAPIHGVPSPR